MSRCLAGIAAVVLFATCCTLLIAVPRAAQATPVLITTEGLAGIDLAQRDSAGTLRLFEADDADGDGMISLVVDLDLPQGSASATVVHIKSGPSQSHFVAVFTDIIVSSAQAMLPYAFLTTGTADRTIAIWNSLPASALTPGTSYHVDNGRISGFDVVVYRSDGFRSAEEIVGSDLTMLTLYSGTTEVGGLLRFQVVPEPSGALLLLVMSLCGLAGRRYIHRGRGPGG